MSLTAKAENQTSLERALAEVTRRYPLEAAMVLSGDTTVEDCASKMKEHGLTGVVISESPRTLDGIFTDRDLFLNLNSKVANLIWTAPVRTVMSWPLITVSPELIHEAPAIMARNKLRHLPVVMNAEGRIPSVLGLLTMDSIFNQNVEAKASFLDYAAGDRAVNPIGVLSEDKFLAGRITETLGEMSNVRVRTIRRAETMLPNLLASVADGINSLVIDVDDYDVRKLGRLLRLVLGFSKMRKIVLVFSSAAIEDAMRTLLKQLASTPPFTLLAKPVEARELISIFSI
ncbi:MAG: CBS domain-containing protein [Deltaproteobacteria bacterium]|nr:CBS domain-containing protein [Deltaproteobacteria bacterium]